MHCIGSSAFLNGIAIMTLAATALAAVPHSGTHRALGTFEKRSPQCTPQNMSPGVSEYGCPAKNTAESSGDCLKPIGKFPTNEGCAAYCEARITMSYGQEVPFSAGYCPDDVSCSIAKATSITVTNTWTVTSEVNLGKVPIPGLSNLEGAFKLGASYSSSKALAFTDTSGENHDKNSGCGYWTFIPFMIESCGSLTIAETVMPGELEMCNKQNFETVKNYCNKYAYTDSNGKADGIVMFVQVDCKTHTLLPMDKQRPEYAYPGVSTGPNTK